MIVFGIVKLVKLVHHSNADPPIEVTDDGKETDVRLVHCANAPPLIDVIGDKIVALVKFIHS